MEKYKILELLDIREGVSAAGPWKSREVVVEAVQEYAYPDCYVVTLFGVDNVDGFTAKVGDIVELSLHHRVRKYEATGRWFQEIRVVKYQI